MKTLPYLLAVLTSVLSNCETNGCSCIGESTVKNEIKHTDVVFVGTITESEEIQIYHLVSPNDTVHSVEMKYTMVIETVYKGRRISDTAYIITGSGGGDCGFNFQTGQKYIVYGEHLKTVKGYNEQVLIGNKSTFYTTICTRTRAFNDEEIKEINKYVKKRKLKHKK